MIAGRVLDLEELLSRRRRWRRDGQTVVFTNGCFDLLHAGHVRYLNAARGLGDRLVVGLNSDSSVRRLKGEGRPVTPEAERAELLAALDAVNAVCLFAEETPLRLIELLTPDLLVKGGDWAPEAIVGRDHVLAHGGRVLTIPVVEGRSTTALLARLGGARP
ncbi:MAG: D-glycero-beta-D-manno-heptose 1-phosphate adenylyltransferase [Acidobacteriota bacterium]